MWDSRQPSLFNTSKITQRLELDVHVLLQTEWTADMTVLLVQETQ